MRIKIVKIKEDKREKLYVKLKLSKMNFKANVFIYLILSKKIKGKK